MRRMRYYSLVRNELQVQLTCVAINARRALVLRNVEGVSVYRGQLTHPDHAAGRLGPR